MLAGESDSTEKEKRETYDIATQLKDYKVSVCIRVHVPTVCSTGICNLLMVNRTQYNCVQSLDCP